MTENRVKDIRKRLPEGVWSIIHECVGRASMCWTNIERAGVFDSDRASVVALDLCNFVANELDKARGASSAVNVVSPHTGVVTFPAANASPPAVNAVGPDGGVVTFPNGPKAGFRVFDLADDGAAKRLEASLTHARRGMDDFDRVNAIADQGDYSWMRIRVVEMLQAKPFVSFGIKAYWGGSNVWICDRPDFRSWHEDAEGTHAVVFDGRNDYGMKEVILREPRLVAGPPPEIAVPYAPYVETSAGRTLTSVGVWSNVPDDETSPPAVEPTAKTWRDRAIDDPMF